MSEVDWDEFLTNINNLVKPQKAELDDLERQRATEAIAKINQAFQQKPLDGTDEDA